MIRRILVEAEVRASAMVVPKVRRERASQVPLVEDDHVVETFATNGPNEALNVRILPRLSGLETTSPMPRLAIRRRTVSL